MKNLIPTLICLFLVVPSQAGIIYVDADANGANDGTSWANAYNYLQDALSVAGDGNDIWVAEGTYKPAGPGGSRTATFQLINGVALKGGYAGFGEPDPNARDIEAYETVLSSDLDGNDVGFANNAENSYHVVTGSGTDSNAVLDGFTLTAGNANGSGTDRNGGGMYNYSGGPTLTNCTFSGNSADYDGGGMYNYAGSNPAITNCTFSRNSADYGGGMFNYKDSSPMLTNCTFSGNSANFGGGMYNYEDSSPMLTNCTFSGNSANHGGGMYNNDDSSPTVTNCTFSGNSADYAGGMYNKSSSPMLTNCILWGDTHQEVSVVGAVITYSDVQGGWPDTGNIDTDPCFVEPGYWADANDPNIIVEPNDPNAIWVDGDYHLKSEAGRWQPSIYADLDPTADRFINLLDFAAFASFWREKGGFIPADMDNTGLVDLSDLALLLDNYLMSYTLGVWVFDEVTSPCIDAGDPSSDWTAELWPHGKRINMGAYGGTPQASMSLSDAGNIANLDNDPADNVDFNDLGIFVTKWCEEELLMAEDLNRDGVVNFVDYTIFAGHWLEDTSP